MFSCLVPQLPHAVTIRRPSQKDICQIRHEWIGNTGEEANSLPLFIGDFYDPVKKEKQLPFFSFLPLLHPLKIQESHLHCFIEDEDIDGDEAEEEVEEEEDCKAGGCFSAPDKNSSHLRTISLTCFDCGAGVNNDLLSSLPSLAFVSPSPTLDSRMAGSSEARGLTTRRM